MSETLFKEVGYSLSKLMEDIEMGEIGLPDIQRPFVWKNSKVRDLFDSMYRGYPVGYLLFWENQLEVGVRRIGTNVHQRVPNLLIVDGQQRLTSLYAVLKGIKVVRENYEQEHIEIAFRPWVALSRSPMQRFARTPNTYRISPNSSPRMPANIKSLATTSTILSAYAALQGSNSHRKKFTRRHRRCSDCLT